MTECEFFDKNIPLIVEMIVLSRSLTDEEYEDWKHERLNNPGITVFEKRMIAVIDKLR